MKEQRWELRYRTLTADGWQDRVRYPNSEAKKQFYLDQISRYTTLSFVSCKKMYPFDMWNNQHNFELISNICYNRMHDMDSGEIPFDSDEYVRLLDLKDKAERLFGMMTGPVTWLVWDDLKDAQELSMMAKNHRVNACIENGRPDLAQYC